MYYLSQADGVNQQLFEVVVVIRRDDPSLARPRARAIHRSAIHTSLWRAPLPLARPPRDITLHSVIFTISSLSLRASSAPLCTPRGITTRVVIFTISSLSLRASSAPLCTPRGIKTRVVIFTISSLAICTTGARPFRRLLCRSPARMVGRCCCCSFALGLRLGFGRRVSC